MDQLIPILVQLVSQHPALMTIFIVMGVMRSIFKPLFTLFHAYVESTEGVEDDKFLEKVEKSNVYKAIVFILDLFGSIKIPKKDA